MSDKYTVLVTGGAGYVGAVLVPKLLADGHRVRVIDTYWYGDYVLGAVKSHPHLTEIKADIRDPEALDYALTGCTAVIHLACVSNDPSFELDPALGKSINFDCFPHMVDASIAAGVERFVYASSSSVYGIKETEDVAEDLPLEPLTDYSKYKALCEEVLLDKRRDGFTSVILRPATLCGYSPRQRLDLTVNILTNHAVNRGKITVFGGAQKRPNLHVGDMVDVYLRMLTYDARLIDGEVFNVGYENHSVAALAEMVRQVVDPNLEIETVPTDDQRSYHISSEKIGRVLGYRPRHTVEDAVRDLVAAFRAGLLPDSMTAPRYFNIKTMQALALA